MRPTSPLRLLLLILGGMAASCGSSPSPAASPTSPSGASSCTYTVITPPLAFTSAGGTATVIVTGTENCSWSASSDALWVRIGSPAGGTGTGTFNVEVVANTASAARSATIVVATYALQVTQDGRPGTVYAAPPRVTGVTSDQGR